MTDKIELLHAQPATLVAPKIRATGGAKWPGYASSRVLSDRSGTGAASAATSTRSNRRGTLLAETGIQPRRQAGFTLLEIMIALTLGLLLSIGIVGLFSGTSHANRVQDGLARLQENGRYAVARLELDLRMSRGQYCSNTSGNAATTGSVATWSGRAPMVFAPNLNLPDVGAKKVSVDASGNLSNVPATAPYVLSPRFFMQGYRCVSGTCTPAVPSGAGQIPAAGLAAGSRVPNSDVLTIRYQRGSGWPMTIDGNCNAGGSVTVNPQAGDDPVAFSAGAGLALISDCQNPSILPVSGFSGNVINIGAMLPGAPTCKGIALRDVRVFNFSDDFVTVSYYLAFRNDDNPDAQRNSAAAKRLIPTLIRRENGTDQELVQGVDRLDFRFGVQGDDGNSRFLSADKVNNRNGGTITCPTKPEGVAPSPTIPAISEPGCLWRAVRVVETHLLMNTVNDVAGLDVTSRSYRYTFNATGGAAGAAVDQTTLPSGLNLSSMLRKEFIAQTASRNYIP